MTLPLRQLFSTSFILFVGLLAATALQAWTGPTATAPGDNVPAPINVGSGTQTKVGGLLNVYDFWVNDAMGIAGGMTVGGKVGVDLPSGSSPVVPLDVNGTIIVGNSGEVCQAVTAGAVRYNANTNALEYCNGTAWAALGSGAGGSSTPTLHSQVYTSSATWTAPAGTSASTVYKVTVVGGGGGGGGYGNDGPDSWSAGGDGGPAGACVKWVSGFAAGSTAGVTVGAGGTGAPAAYANGSVGGTSKFGTYCSANGGGGGTGTTWGSSGRVGTGGTATGGDLNLTGGTSATAVPIIGGAGTYGGGGSGGGSGGGGGGKPGVVFIEWVQ